MREPQILAAAARVFAERGFAAGSMDEVASEAGISKPLVYAYFGSKERLFIACQRGANEELEELLRGAASRRDLPPDQRLWEALLATFRFIEQRRDVWRVYHLSPSSGGEAIAARGAANRRRFGGLVAELLIEVARERGVGPQAAEQIPPLAHALTGATVELANWWLEHPDEPSELQALRLMNFAWNGLGNLLAGEMWLPPVD